MIKPYILIALLLAVTATPLFAQNDVKEQLVVPLTEPGKTGSLSVDLINGFIHVVGYSGKDIVIDASSSGRQRTQNNDQPAGGMRRISRRRTTS